MAVRDATILVEAGATVFKAGADPDCVYYVEDGLVDIVLDADSANPTLLVTRCRGQIFGELAIIDAGPRFASAIARTPCRLLPIRAERLARDFAKADALLRLVVDTLLHRLREQIHPVDWSLAKRGRFTTSAYGRSQAGDISSEAIADQAIAQIRRENDLRKAIEAGAIDLHHQPVVSLSTGAIVGFEALARWNHHEDGLLQPSDFIPLAETSGLIGNLTRLCITKALGCLPALRAAARATGSPMPFINVNVTSQDLMDERLADFLKEATRTNPADRRRLKIEITENALMANPTDASHTLRRCRDLGIGIAVDDFGTGYSSLAYLHTLPINVLKIDRSFVRSMSADPQSAKIIRTIIRLAGELELPVVCEGIETEGELEALVEMNCGFGQGFLFGQPMPIDAIPEFYRGWRSARRPAAPAGSVRRTLEEV